jgi:hypothetical protein
MHGSSSVPQELLAEIREFGGDMKETYGVPVEEIVKGIAHGVRKVNIDTDIRLAMTGAIRRYLTENPDKFDPRDYLKPAREAAKKICLARLRSLRLCRSGKQDQGYPTGKDGRALRQGRVEPDRQISAFFSIDPRASRSFCSRSRAAERRLFRFCAAASQEIGIGRVKRSAKNSTAIKTPTRPARTSRANRIWTNPAQRPLPQTQK